MRRRSGCCSAPWGRSPLTLCRGRVTSFKKSSPRPSSRPWVVSRRVSRGARDVEPDRRVMLSEAGRSGGAGSPSTLACGTRMRIALVAEDYYPQFGGVPEHVHNLALQLNSWGHTATVVTSHMGAYPDAAFVRRVGTSRMIYSNGGVSRITTGWGLRRHLEALRLAGRHSGGRHLPLVVRALARLSRVPATAPEDPRPARGDDRGERAGGGREFAVLSCPLGHHSERRGRRVFPTERASSHRRAHARPAAPVPRSHRAAQRLGHGAGGTASHPGAPPERGAHGCRGRPLAGLL